MDEKARDLVERLHREAVERLEKEKEEDLALIEAAHREALERRREVEESQRALVETLHRAALQHFAETPRVQAELPTIHYSKLPQADPASALFTEWNTYRREVGRLLEENQQGRFVLIKGDEIIGLWDNEREAFAAGYQRFLGKAFMVHQVQERESVLRCISVRSCRNIRMPFRLAS